MITTTEAALREASDALSDDRSETGRNARVGVRLGDPPLVVQEPYDLGSEERIPLRLVVNRVNQPGGGLDPRQQLDVLGKV